MPNFQNAKIYKISAEGYDDYYGSTTLTLENRMRAFRNSKKNYSCSSLIGSGLGVIELVEEYPCDTRAELMTRERYWIDNNPCCNKAKPIRTDLENKEYHKNYNKTYLRKKPSTPATKEKNAEYCRRWYLKKKGD